LIAANDCRLGYDEEGRRRLIKGKELEEDSEVKKWVPFW
jgi:hypothetical protein